MINGKNGQETHCTKIGSDKLAENTPKAPKFILQICLPKPKSVGFRWKKASSGVCSPCLYFLIYIFDFFCRLHSLLHSLTMFWRFQRICPYMSQLWSYCWIEGKTSRYFLSFAHFCSLKIIIWLSFISTKYKLSLLLP